MTQETFTFQTEVGRLLEIVAHSLYSHKEIFLRELISNASDACDRLRYLALTEPHLTEGDVEFRICIEVDREQRTLTVIDNGVGMNRDDLLETLGTIARSGTQAFLGRLTGDAKKDVSLIGQFGVGFYSAFMVAKEVEVLTRKAGEESAWRWSSDGKGAFTIADAERPERGTTVILRLADDADEFIEESRLQHIIKKYSDHIGFPIRIGADDSAAPVNAASSLWTLPKKDITAEQYKEFYHHVGHAFDDPWLILHNTVEGVVSYTNLLFVPKQAPFDLFDPERKARVKLYVRRVFITDDCEGLLPAYLRFVRGVVDSEDLPLNISRESFQHDPRLAKIRSGLVKRTLDELAKKVEDAPAEYAEFWEAFGAVLKEGIYEDFENRDRLLGLARFHSTSSDSTASDSMASDGLVSLDTYLERMKPGQDAIYTITGEQVEALRRSPQLEGFKAKGVEVLLLTDPIDEFWVPMVRTYKDKPFRSATGADADLGKIEAPEAETEVAKPAEETVPATDLDRLVVVLKVVLDKAVKDVRVSSRLTDSAVCLVAGEGDMDMYMERLLRQHRRLEADAVTPRILEINPGHLLIRKLAARAAAGDGAAELADAAWLLLDQARIVEGDALTDPVAFARRLSAMMARGLAGDPDAVTTEPPTQSQSAKPVSVASESTEAGQGAASHDEDETGSGEQTDASPTTEPAV
ncbi:MAG: molecular chaperone HtpG [Defluviicoccus sp.]|nr:MAG: molecular chaperone HtpG [Defluviicoccus sp.]